MPAPLCRPNADILTIADHLLGSLERQRVYVLKRLLVQQACPNCGHEQNYLEATGLTLETIDLSKQRGDDCTCVNCHRTIRYIVPLVSLAGPGWKWSLIPIRVHFGLGVDDGVSTKNCID